MTDLRFFLVRADFVLFATILTALHLFSSSDGTDPGGVFLPTSAGVNQITP